MMAYNYGNYQNQGYTFAARQPYITLIPVRGREMAEGWAVAPGTSAYFLDETAPYLYVKTGNFSPIGGTTFEAYPLKKEELAHEASESPKTVVASDVDKNTFDEINGQISRLWAAVEEIRGKKGGQSDESAS